MIKANELRIGNYLQYNNNGIPVKLKIIKNDVCYYNLNCYSSIESMEPIPLTEELLLKCGFEKKGLEYIKGSFFFFAQSVKADGTFINTEFGKYRGNVRFVISFTVENLHDLQNTYFYNNNKKELEINL